MNVHSVFDHNLASVFESTKGNCWVRRFELGVDRCLLSLVDCVSNIYLEYHPRLQICKDYKFPDVHIDNNGCNF